ncbi:MAG: hypothetical protein HQK77_05440 [Desulfobacterales bacterium]|nr:hypothetical protein [Desulfobacterales bacterium]
MLNDLCVFQKNLKNKGVFFAFSGPLSQQVIIDISNIIKKRITMEHESTYTNLRVLSIVIELAQNIAKYSSETIFDETTPNIKENFRCGIILIGKKDNEYFVVSGNNIQNQKIEPLSSSLNSLLQMNKESLKQFYKEQRRKGPSMVGRLGAGLGFIEIARKVNRPFEFAFNTIDEDTSFFSFTATVCPVTSGAEI